MYTFKIFYSVCVPYLTTLVAKIAARIVLGIIDQVGNWQGEQEAHWCQQINYCNEKFSIQLLGWPQD